MQTIKLVVIGSSGVGKTSLRGKYISGRFSTGYRATIGADFITKTLPHPNDATSTITLQIWDTAGQERFSSLSSAFFRGADAAILMFDVNDRSTMLATKKWWSDFCDKAPLAEEDVAEYCCVLVGNKVDAAVIIAQDSGGESRVSESEALEFMDEIVLSDAQQEEATPIPISLSDTGNHHRGGNTSSAAHTILTIYHTPSSTYISSPTFDDDNDNYDARSPISSIYQSARSSPEDLFSDVLPSPRRKKRRRMTVVSRESTGSDSVVTITPSRFASQQQQQQTIHDHLSSPGYSPSSPDLSPNANSNVNTNHHNHHHHHKTQTPQPPDRGPRLFFTSAKTGEGVNELFEYIAHRVMRKWEYDDWLESRKMHFRDATSANTLLSSGEAAGAGGVVRLGGMIGRGGAGGAGGAPQCCRS